MLKMNYSDYEKKDLGAVYKQATRRGITPFLPSSNFSFKKREDIIGEIIAYDAYYEGRNDVMRERCEPVETNPVKNENKRKAYQLQEEDCDPIFLKLTPAQAKFAEWCIKNQVNFCCALFKEFDNIEYVSP